jgi:TolA-binding protein
LSPAALARIGAAVAAARTERRAWPIQLRAALALSFAAAVVLLVAALRPSSSVVATSGALELPKGVLLVRTERQPVAVLTPSGRIEVQPNSRMEIRVGEQRALRVAAFEGSAIFGSGADAVVIRANRVFSYPEGSDSSQEVQQEHQVQQAQPIQQAQPPLPPAAPEPTRTRSRRVAALSRSLAAETPTPSEPIAPPPSPKPPEPPALEPPAPGESALALQARLLAAAIERLRKAHDAKGALVLLDELEARYAGGPVSTEAMLLRLEALLSIGKRKQALALLDGGSFEGAPRQEELRLLRGELRAQAGRCGEALDDFQPMAGPGGGLAERALYGQASCHATLGDRTRARQELERYLELYPKGAFAAKARQALEP